MKKSPHPPAQILKISKILMSQAIGVPVPFLNKSLEAKDTCLPALGWVQVQVVLLRKFSQWEMLREWRKEEEENSQSKLISEDSLANLWSHKELRSIFAYQSLFPSWRKRAGLLQLHTCHWPQVVLSKYNLLDIFSSGSLEVRQL